MALEGALVVLREEQREDQKLFAELRNDLDTQAWNLALPPSYTEEMHVKRFDAMEFSYERRSARLVIVHKETGALAGYISYTDLQPRLSASIGLVVAKPFWGTRVALDAQEVLLRFLFHELGLRVVHLWTHSGNPRAVGLAEKSGFRISARIREATYRNGRLLDTLVMSLTRDGYGERHAEFQDTLPDPTALLRP
ncbi:MAG: GNAT family protein [Candidatus Bipolaricaulis sp.]|nr:GNAT family protein [Candidatus Bipolaricaulis sp.]